MRTRPYVGIYIDHNSIAPLQYERFRATDTPTRESHPKYNAVIGPFRTMRGALFMVVFGRNNPHCRNVVEAERLGLKYQAELRTSMRKFANAAR